MASSRLDTGRLEQFEKLSLNAIAEMLSDETLFTTPIAPTFDMKILLKSVVEYSVARKVACWRRIFCKLTKERFQELRNLRQFMCSIYASMNYSFQGDLIFEDIDSIFARGLDGTDEKCRRFVVAIGSLLVKLYESKFGEGLLDQEAQLSTEVGETLMGLYEESCLQNSIWKTRLYLLEKDTKKLKHALVLKITTEPVKLNCPESQEATRQEECYSQFEIKKLEYTELFRKKAAEEELSLQKIIKIKNQLELEQATYEKIRKDKINLELEKDSLENESEALSLLYANKPAFHTSITWLRSLIALKDNLDSHFEATGLTMPVSEFIRDLENFSDAEWQQMKLVAEHETNSTTADRNRYLELANKKSSKEKDISAFNSSKAMPTSSTSDNVVAIEGGKETPQGYASVDFSSVLTDDDDPNTDISDLLAQIPNL